MPTTGIDRPNQTKTLWILTAAVATGLIAAMLIPGIGTTLILVQVGFVVLHGAWRYGWRAIAVFIVAGLVISNILENLSVQTGFPFGHYHYTGDGKIFQVPWYIGPAYLATGYLAWIVATTVLADVHRNSPWLTTIGTPIVGAVANDLLGPGNGPEQRDDQPVVDLGKRRWLLRRTASQLPGLDANRLPVHASLRPLSAQPRPGAISNADTNRQ